MGFLGKVKETFRDKTRDNLCANLQSLGVDARMAERGQAEEDIGRKDPNKSLGLIDIAEGPTRWINVVAVQQPNWVTNLWFIYGVPDPRIEPNLTKVRIKSIRMKDFPLFGQVVDLRWKGKDIGLGIIERLNGDVLLKQPIISSCDAIITAHCYNPPRSPESIMLGTPPDREEIRCWIISTPGFSKEL